MYMSANSPPAADMARASACVIEVGRVGSVRRSTLSPGRTANTFSTSRLAVGAMMDSFTENTPLIQFRVNIPGPSRTENNLLTTTPTI
jgi:hypothetical protein